MASCAGWTIYYSQVSFQVAVSCLHLHTLSIKYSIFDIADYFDMDAPHSSGRYWFSYCMRETALLRPQTCINNNTTVAAILGYNTVTDAAMLGCVHAIPSFNGD
jgi:hypothetical protein